MKEKETEFYFLTATIVEWTPIFLSQKYFEIITESLKFCQTKKELRIAGYVIMPNHLHLIVADTSSFPLSDTMRDFKHYTARKIVESLKDENRTTFITVLQQAALSDGHGSQHKAWLEGNHPVLVEDGFMFLEKLKYLHNNPVRKGFVDEPEHWVYSSARNYVQRDHTVLRVEIIQ